MRSFMTSTNGIVIINGAVIIGCSQLHSAKSNFESLAF